MKDGISGASSAHDSEEDEPETHREEPAVQEAPRHGADEMQPSHSAHNNDEGEQIASCTADQRRVATVAQASCIIHNH